MSSAALQIKLDPDGETASRRARIPRISRAGREQMAQWLRVSGDSRTLARGDANGDVFVLGTMEEDRGRLCDQP